MGQGTVDEPFEAPLAPQKAQHNPSTSDAAPDAIGARASCNTAKVPQAAEEKPSSRTSVAAGSQDSALEYDSMVLMSKLEQYVIKLSDKAAQASLILALEYLVELTNHIVEFAEKLSPSGQTMSLEVLLARDQKNYRLLAPQHITEHRLAIANDPALTQGALNNPQTFQQFSNDILRVINIYLSINVKAFQTPRIAAQWQTLYKGFYKHLINAIRQIQAGNNN